MEWHRGSRYDALLRAASAPVGWRCRAVRRKPWENYREAGDLEALPTHHTLFANVDAADRAVSRTSFAGNARSQVVTVKTAEAGIDFGRQLGVLVLLGERPLPRIVSPQPIAERNQQGFHHRDNRLIDGL